MQNIRFIPPLILNLLCMTCQLGSDAEKKNRSICASQGSALHPAGRSRLINNFGNILALYLLLGNCPQLRRRQNPCLPVLRKITNTLFFGQIQFMCTIYNVKVDI